MKKIFLILLGLILTQSIMAGERWLGITLGGGLAQGYGSRDQAEDYEVEILSHSIQRAGIFSYYQISEGFGLQQEVLYSQKGSRQNIRHKEEPVNLGVTYKLEYLEIPFMFRQKLFRVGESSIWSGAGFSFSWLLAGEYYLAGTVQVGEEMIPLNDSYSLSSLDEFDYSFLYGISLESELFHLPLIFEYRFSLSWYKIAFPTFQDLAPVQLCNQVHSITLSTMFKL